MPPALILSSDSHVFEPPDLWTTRIDRAFRERAPRYMTGQLRYEQAAEGIDLCVSARRSAHRLDEFARALQ